MRWALALVLCALAGPARAEQPLTLHVRDDGRWTVEAPGTGPLSTLALVEAWQDREGALRLRRAELGSWILLGAEVAAGAALTAGALAAFERSNDYLPRRGGFAVSRGDYRTREDYLYAREQAEIAYQAALATVPQGRRMQAEDKAWTGFSLAISATLCLGLAPLHKVRFQRLARDPERFYSLVEASALLAAHAEAREEEAARPDRELLWPAAIPGRGATSRAVEAW